MKMHIHNPVRVRLTDYGREIHREVKGPLALRANVTYRPPEEDEEGWSKWRLHELLALYGDYLYPGAKLPFETEIEVLESN